MCVCVRRVCSPSSPCFSLCAVMKSVMSSGEALTPDVCVRCVCVCVRCVCVCVCGCVMCAVAHASLCVALSAYVCCIGVCVCVMCVCVCVCVCVRRVCSPSSPCFSLSVLQSVMSSGEALTPAKTGAVGSAIFHLHDNGTLDYQVREGSVVKYAIGRWGSVMSVHKQ